MEKMKLNTVWGQDIYEYIKMCDQIAKESSKNWILGVNGPVGIGKKYLIKSICEEIQRRFICISYKKLFESGYSLIEKHVLEKDREPLLFYIEGIQKNDTNYSMEIDFLVEFIRSSIKIKKCIFVFSSTAIMGSNSPINVSFRVFRYGCLSLDEKIEFAHEIVTKCQRQWNLENIDLPDMSIKILIKHYTKEAGINYLAALICNLYEKIYYEKKYRQVDPEPTEITNKTIFRILGSGCYVYDELITEKCVQGIGMAWTRWGGELLPIQIETNQGKGQIIYSSNIGNLMKESIEVVFQYLKRNYEVWRIPKKDIYRRDFYIKAFIALELLFSAASLILYCFNHATGGSIETFLNNCTYYEISGSALLYANPNTAGIMAGFSIVLAIVLYGKNGYDKRFVLLFGIFNVAALVIFGCRSADVGILFILAVMAVQKYFNCKKKTAVFMLFLLTGPCGRGRCSECP